MQATYNITPLLISRRLKQLKRQIAECEIRELDTLTTEFVDLQNFIAEKIPHDPGLHQALFDEINLLLSERRKAVELQPTEVSSSSNSFHFPYPFIQADDEFLYTSSDEDETRLNNSW